MPDFSLTLTLPELAALLRGKEPVRLSPEAQQRIADGYADWRAQAATVPYPHPAPQPDLPPAEQAQRQTNLLLAHAAGTGPELPPELVRRLLLLKAHRLSQGRHGVALATVRRLLDFYNREVWPVVPEPGAAVGDQLPLAHLALPLLGLGEVNYQGYRLAAADVLDLLGWAPLALEAHEGPALLSGQELSLAYATEATERAAHLLRAATTIAALSLDVFGAAGEPWHEAQPHSATSGAGAVAARLRALLTDSALPSQLGAVPLNEPAPLAFRGVPQVHRAAQEALAYAQEVVESACQPRSEPVAAFTHSHSPPSDADELSTHSLSLVINRILSSLAELGHLSAQRTGHLVAGRRGLPAHLTATPALDFGLLGLPLAAASLTAHNQQLSLPSPSPDGGASAGPNARRLVENVEQLVGIELLVATQALDFRRPGGFGPARTSPALEAVVAAFRQHVTFVAHDRVLAPDLHRAARFVREFAWD